MNRPAMRMFSLVFAAALPFLSTPLAPAQQAGFDLFQTATSTAVDLHKLGLGLVYLKGVPIEKSLGNTDTIMHRTKDVPAGGGDVPVEVFALFMKSRTPVNFKPPGASGKPQRADVYVTINNSGGKIPTSVLTQPDALKPSDGTLAVRKNHTFTSKITVNADLLFVRAGGSPAKAGDILHHQPADSILLTSSLSQWSSTPPHGYPMTQEFPAGKFYPKPKHKNKGHPVTPSTCTGGPTRIGPTGPTEEEGGAGSCKPAP